jgi:hypothetical protein
MGCEQLRSTSMQLLPQALPELQVTQQTPGDVHTCSARVVELVAPSSSVTSSRMV